MKYQQQPQQGYEGGYGVGGGGGGALFVILPGGAPLNLNKEGGKKINCGADIFNLLLFIYILNVTSKCEMPAHFLLSLFSILPLS